MPDRRSILVSWIGHADLNGMAKADPAFEPLVRKTIKKSVLGETGYGPIRAMLAHRQFDEVHLISNYPPELTRAFAKWLHHSSKPQIHHANVTNPTDYRAVFDAANDALIMATKSGALDPIELWIGLSSGTPAMAATLVLLGKSRFPARFLQSHLDKAAEEKIPFDLVVDFVPELLKDPDSNLQRLAENRPADVTGFGDIIGDSHAIRLAVGRAKRAAIRDVSVLLLGESGVGKELFARAIHGASHRRDGPFVAVNCAALPREIIESVLFGHKKGAFTGAQKDHRGAFHEADGGTLFLDEFGECDLDTQSKLLRVLQPGINDAPTRRVFRAVGAEKDQSADVRIVAATNCDPQQEIKKRRMREDLYYRVATVPIRIPSLRERRSDIPAIAEALLRRINTEFAKSEPGYEYKAISAAAKNFVLRADWPGNVRQLGNALTQAAVMASGASLSKADLEAALTETPDQTGPESGVDQPIGGGFSLQDHLNRVEMAFLQRAMHESNGVKTRAAELLGLKSYQTLDGKLKRLGVK